MCIAYKFGELDSRPVTPVHWLDSNQLAKSKQRAVSMAQCEQSS